MSRQLSVLLPYVLLAMGAGILGGLAAGGLVMIGLKWLVLRFERREKGRGRLPVGLAGAAAVDTLFDGAIISAGFSSGQRLGTLLAMALAIELFFLTLSVGAEFRRSKSPRWQGLAVTSAIAGLLLVGALSASVSLRGAVRSHDRSRSGIRGGGADLSDRGGAAGRGHSG